MVLKTQRPVLLRLKCQLGPKRVAILRVARQLGHTRRFRHENLECYIRIHLDRLPSCFD